MLSYCVFQCIIYSQIHTGLSHTTVQPVCQYAASASWGSSKTIAPDCCPHALWPQQRPKLQHPRCDKLSSLHFMDQPPRTRMYRTSEQWNRKTVVAWWWIPYIHIYLISTCIYLLWVLVSWSVDLWPPLIPIEPCWKLQPWHREVLHPLASPWSREHHTPASPETCGQGTIAWTHRQ